MALTASKMIELGLKAPDFTLADVVSGKLIKFQDIKGIKGTLVMFICNHCPYVIHIQQKLVEIADQFIPQGVGFVAISSNDSIHYPADNPENLRKQAKANHFQFPYLFDESQQITIAYGAVCTPDFFLYDADDLSVYRGRLDESRPGNDIPVTGVDLVTALKQLVQGLPIGTEQYPSMGCNIKWKN